jgi:hypothetical protein
MTTIFDSCRASGGQSDSCINDSIDAAVQMALTQIAVRNDDGSVASNADGSVRKQPVLRFTCLVRFTYDFTRIV